VIGDSDQRRYSGAAELTSLTAQLVSFRLRHDSLGNVPTVDGHDRLLPGEGCGCLLCCIVLGLLALGESTRGHVVLHHGALLEVVPDGQAAVPSA
jgi:hypothetical protein